MWRDYRQHKKDKAVSIKEALWETAFRVAVATVFGGVVWLLKGGESTVQYFSGYLLEKSLSVDNLFVMIAIFTSFHIPEKYRHRVLYFGILGAIVLRLLFISAGTALLSLGEWVLAVFGLIVLITAVKMVMEERKKHQKSVLPEGEHDYSKGGIATFVKKFFPVHTKVEGHDFFVKEDGKRHATALFLALVVIEISDVLFAFDSIPAILSISQDTFIVFASNIFAILGLRALYFVLEAVGNKRKYVSYAVIGILFFVGLKMLLSLLGVHIGSLISLAVIILALARGI
jgi:tellurite resistance protein TerC